MNTGCLQIGRQARQLHKQEEFTTKCVNLITGQNQRVHMLLTFDYDKKNVGHMWVNTEKCVE